MEKQQKKEMNRIYTQFVGGEIRMEAYPVRLVLHHLPEGLLHSSVSALDQKQMWSCEHTGKQSLAEYCEQKELGNEEFRWIYGSLLKNLKETQEFLLDENHLFLEPEEIYLSETERKVWNCYVPFYEKDIWQSLRELSQYLLGHLDQQDSDAVRIAYGMFRYFSQGGCSIEWAWEILCEKAAFPGEIQQEERTEERGGTSSRFIEIVQEESTPRNPLNGDTKNRFPMAGWIIMGLSGATAVFLLAYVMLNEWYLSDTGKIVILALIILLAGVGTVAWKYWHQKMERKNPLEDEVEEAVGAKGGQVRLIRTDTKEAITVSQFPAVIGKLSEGTQVQIKEPAVSRIHARLTCTQGKYYLEDMDSRNGTYVNKARLEPQKPVHLRGGDELVFANIHYYLQL